MKPASKTRNTAVARTVRFPTALQARIAADAERCNRSYESQVLAILRRHYGEDVDVAPQPSAILEMARASFFGISEADRKLITKRLVEE